MQTKVFMSKQDIKALFGTGVSSYFINKVFAEIKAKAETELKAKNKMLPNKSTIPTMYVREYVRDYGIEI